jgi:hypothetical protein
MDHTVDQMVPVDCSLQPQLSLVLLELPAEEVPVGGTEPPAAGTTSEDNAQDRCPLIVAIADIASGMITLRHEAA